MASMASNSPLKEKLMNPFLKFRDVASEVLKHKDRHEERGGRARASTVSGASRMRESTSTGSTRRSSHAAMGRSPTSNSQSGHHSDWGGGFRLLKMMHGKKRND